MDNLTILNSLSSVSSIGNILSQSQKTSGDGKNGLTSFADFLESAKGLIKETEDYTNKAEEAELSYMLGINDSISDLLVAQTKANISLQYTIAVRNAVMDAYKEIMNLQF